MAPRMDTTVYMRAFALLGRGRFALIGEKMLEFRKYGPAPCPEETEPPICVVTYPEACGRPAVGEVWCLSFCQAHGTEAHVAARLEAYEDAGRELDRLTGAVEGAHAVRNPLVYEALKGTTFPSRGIHLDHYDAIRAAYDLDAATTDPATRWLTTTTRSLATRPTTGIARRGRWSWASCARLTRPDSPNS